MKYFLSIFLIALLCPVQADEGIDITEPALVSELNNLQEKIESVTAAIRECMDAGEEHEICMCKHKNLINEFNITARNIFSNYPDLRNLDVVRFKSPDGLWVSQSLEGIRSQASMEPCRT